MPTYRRDIAAINPYVPGRAIDVVGREIGMSPDDIVKLASNESPFGPFPGVVEAVAEAAAGANRYPDNDALELREALSVSLGVPPDHLWLGAGSVALLDQIALAVGGPGTTSVYAWPSFVIYRTASIYAMTEPIEVPLGSGEAHDLEAMEQALKDDTTVVYLCNPNNPTGTIVSSAAVEGFIGAMPESVLVVIDEAYHHYATDPSYATALPIALSRPNVVVLRTFSKIFGLAAMRIGFAVGVPETLSQLRKAQHPFTVSQVAQSAARASLGQPDEVERRRHHNTVARSHLLDVLTERGLAPTPSQANFVWFRLGETSSAAAEAFLHNGVIIRPMSTGLRVTIGSTQENERFIDVLDQVMPALSPDLA